jgi:hypothetical protein
MNATQTTQGTITIGRREYAVSTQTAQNGELQYILTGKRGAVYGTMRNVKRPEMMFLIDCRGFGPVGKRVLWLTDKNGRLEVVG